MRIPEIQERQRHRMIKYTPEWLISHLVELEKELGHTPRMRDTKPSDDVWMRAFGSYNNALVQAGLTPNRIIPEQILNNPERMLIAIGLRYKVLRRDGFRCQYCGGTPQDGYVLHVDHVVPRSKGGATTEENLITACSLCNLGKSDSWQESAA
jgi:hypothetical protein